MFVVDESLLFSMSVPLHVYKILYFSLTDCKLGRIPIPCPNSVYCICKVHNRIYYRVLHDRVENVQYCFDVGCDIRPFISSEMGI
jgi:hypothetical protein